MEQQQQEFRLAMQQQKEQQRQAVEQQQTELAQQQGAQRLATEKLLAEASNKPCSGCLIA